MRAPAGWCAVEEYVSDDLPDNSEDNKKLRSAERGALTKIRSKKQNRNFSQSRPKFSHEDFVLNRSPFFKHPFEAGNHSLQTNASPMANSGSGPVHLSVQFPVTSAAESCSAVTPLLSLSRLGSYEYSNIVVNLCLSSGLQEKGLLERSYAEYLEGSDSSNALYFTAAHQ